MDLRRLKEHAARQSAQGRYERAEVLYRQLLTHAPRDPSLWLKHAEVLKRLERADPAIASYRMSAQLMMDQGHAHRAIAALKIALSLRPDDVDLVSDIIRCELRQRKRTREFPAVKLEPVPSPDELKQQLADDHEPTRLLALPMFAASDSRLAESVHLEVEVTQRWPQVRRVSEQEVAVKASPSAAWVVVRAEGALEVRFDADYRVAEEAPWLEP